MHSRPKISGNCRITRHTAAKPPSLAAWVLRAGLLTVRLPSSHAARSPAIAAGGDSGALSRSIAQHSSTIPASRRGMHVSSSPSAHLPKAAAAQVAASLPGSRMHSSRGCCNSRKMASFKSCSVSDIRAMSSHAETRASGIAMQCLRNGRMPLCSHCAFVPSSALRARLAQSATRRCSSAGDILQYSGKPSGRGGGPVAVVAELAPSAPVVALWLSAGC